MLRDTVSLGASVGKHEQSYPYLSTKGAQKGASGWCPKTRKLLQIARPRLTPKMLPEPAPEVGNDLRQASLHVSGSENLAKTVTMACGFGGYMSEEPVDDPPGASHRTITLPEAK